VWLIALILALINITYLSRFLSYSHFFVLKPKNWTRHGNHDCASYRKLNLAVDYVGHIKKALIPTFSLQIESIADLTGAMHICAPDASAR